MTLEDLRNQIDSIDNELLELLNRRMGVVKKVGDLKRDSNAIIYRPEREKSILDRLEGQSVGLLNRLAIDAIFLEIFAVARNIELPERIAYLGPEGSFTHQAAESRFGAMSDYSPLPTIKSVFEEVETERAKFGVVPIENNQEGIVNETIDLLNTSNLNIAAEIVNNIHFCFATQAEKFDQITHIYTKDIAFRQCKKFLDDHFDGLKAELVPVESTSKAAKLASLNPKAAAICSHIAAKLFDVPVLFNNIQDNQQNRTRFLIIAKNFINQPSEEDKTTMIVNLQDSDKSGSLVRFLKEFEARNINLIKIESRPVKLSETFRFWFFMEFEGNFNDKDVQEALANTTADVRCLGSYVKIVSNS